MIPCYIGMRSVDEPMQPIILLSDIAHAIYLWTLLGLIYINIKMLGVTLDKKFR